MALDTVQDYVNRARVLLLDTVDSPYRYSTDDLVEALNLAVLETRRLRPDLLKAYFRASLPEFSSASLSTAVPVDPMYRLAVLYYVCGHAHLRDEENVQEARAAAFLNKYVSQLLTIQA